VTRALLVSEAADTLRPSVDEAGRVRILLADGQSLFREAVRVVLSAEDDLLVVAEAGDAVQALAEAERTVPDLALLDAALPPAGGVEAVAAIADRVPSCRVVLISEDEDQAMLIRALEAGASGYLARSCPLSELTDAARAISRGETLIPPRMLGAVLSELIRRRRLQDEARRVVVRLTRREREVLVLLADGADLDAIARSLLISPETARTHIQNVLSKLDVHSRAEAAEFVLQHGILGELVAAD